MNLAVLCICHWYNRVSGLCFYLFLLDNNINVVNSWVGFAFCYIAIMAIYYSNLWNVSPISRAFIVSD